MRPKQSWSIEPIGRILQKIDDLELWENTVVVVTSDHAFSIGEHARVGKTNLHPRDDRYWPLYPEISHIPFLVAAPGIAPGPRPVLAQPVDIMSTINDLANITVEPPESIHGRSFARVLREQTRSHRTMAVCGRWWKPEAKGPPRKATTPFVTDGRWGYVPLGPRGEPELFDLVRDPWGEHNLASRHSGRVQAMHSGLLEYLAEIHAPEDLTEPVRRWAP